MAIDLRHSPLEIAAEAMVYSGDCRDELCLESFESRWALDLDDHKSTAIADDRFLKVECELRSSTITSIHEPLMPMPQVLNTSRYKICVLTYL